MIVLKFLFYLLCFNIRTIYCRSISKEDNIAKDQLFSNNWNENYEVNPEELGNFFEGDIVLNPGRSVVSDLNRRWPNGVIPYEFLDNFNDNELELFDKAIQKYNELSCIRWVPRKEENDYVSFQNENSGCWSSIGRQGGQQLLNLQSSCFFNSGTILHEMLHAAGFIHEQSRPDRDDYVDIIFANIKPSKVHNFEKYKESQINYYGTEYDYGSVMHYSRRAFTNNGEDTIIPKDPNAIIGQRKGFSESDLLRLNRAYNCTGYY